MIPFPPRCKDPCCRGSDGGSKRRLVSCSGHRRGRLRIPGSRYDYTHSQGKIADPWNLTGYRTTEGLANELSLARELLHLTPSDPLPIGVGYLGWQLEEPMAKPEVMLSAALDNRVHAVWLAFGNNLKQWIEFIRNYDAEHKRARQTTIFVQVSSVEEALVASDEWKVDVLVAQGLKISLTV